MARALIRVREWLKEHNGKVSDLAGASGISDSQMSLILSGKRRASPEVAGKIQAITGIDARYVLGIAIPEEVA